MSVALSRFFSNPVIPVVVIDDARHAVPLANALMESGISAIEITLRIDRALHAAGRRIDGRQQHVAIHRLVAAECQGVALDE